MDLGALLITVLVAALIAFIVKVVLDHAAPAYSQIGAFIAFVLVVLVRVGTL